MPLSCGITGSEFEVTGYSLTRGCCGIANLDALLREYTYSSSVHRRCRGAASLIRQWGPCYPLD